MSLASYLQPALHLRLEGVVRPTTVIAQSRRNGDVYTTLEVLRG
jgi:hypothetical protein